MKNNVNALLFCDFNTALLNKVLTLQANGGIISKSLDDINNIWAISSVGQSHRLITGRSGVRVPDGPPYI